MELSIQEQNRRKEIIYHARRCLLNKIHVEAQDEYSLMCTYRGFYLQVSFSELHPLMVFCMAKRLKDPVKNGKYQTVNELNLRSVLGSHALNQGIGCYSYRAAYWMDTEVDSGRICEILDRCVDEAQRGYQKIAG